MSRKTLYVGALLCSLACGLSAGELSGKIIIRKNIAWKNIAPAVYDLRGIAVSDPASDSQNTNEFERIAVWLESNTSLPAASPVTASMEQRNRRFQPTLLVIPVGSTVNFPNLDPIFHNIFSLSRTQSFDLGYYPQGRSRSVKFPRAGVVQVYCHVHPSMYGVIIVTASPWAGKPSENGAFLWSDVPPGKYKLCVWQKSVGLIRQKVVVPDTGAARVTVSLPEQGPES